MEHIFRFRDFIFESQEEFTDGEYALKQSYDRKVHKKEPRTPEENRAYTKWKNLKKANPVAIARFIKDYDYTPFTEEEYDLWLSYEKKHKKGHIQEIKEEEREANKKYHRIYRRGIDPLVNIPMKEIDYTPMTEQEKELVKNYWKKNKSGLDHEIEQEEVDAITKYNRLILLQDDVSLDPTRPFTLEETALYKIYLDKKKRGETPSRSETKAANRFDFLRGLSDEDLE
jgi:hypothetical protein